MSSRISRRSLLAAAGISAAAAAPKTEGPVVALASIQIGSKRVTRLIAGANPVNGYSHSTVRLSNLMEQYFTRERTTEFILHCEKQGITTWQSSYSPKVRDALRDAREKGSKIQFICLAAARQDEFFDEILGMKPIAIVHHGNVTDTNFQKSTPDVVHDYVKRVHDKGLLAGISTHNPDILARMEDLGWENEFYMTCLYNLSRTADEVKKMVGDAVLGELFLEGDPKRMTARVREVRKPCLAFKLLGAGRVSGTAAGVGKAFEFAYKNIKPIDGAIVGMFPILHDEVKEDADLARRFGGRAG
jgi:hypothetical protein